tara:strand:- start:263 stop:490 length:228 start_codon:yes stop_codon:yes gene_type:complete
MKQPYISTFNPVPMKNAADWYNKKAKSNERCKAKMNDQQSIRNQSLPLSIKPETCCFTRSNARQCQRVIEIYIYS